MSEFWLVASIGHCATRWLADVLDAQDGMKAFHELKHHTCGMSWHEAAKYERRNGPASSKYSEYWATIDKEMAENDIVAEVNSWVPHMVQRVCEHRPVDRLIYITRHGVNQLHSMWVGSGVWPDKKLNDYLMNGYIAETSGVDVMGLDRWERMCHFWNGSIRYAYILHKELGADVIKYEDLTQTPYGLQRILPHMTHAQTMHWRRRDINRKVEGSRRPGNLWEQWTPEMRETFTAVCGDVMADMGYEVPK